MVTTSFHTGHSCFWEVIFRRIFRILAVNAGRVVGKKELSEQDLGRPLARFDRSIDVHLSRIRQKLNQFDNGSSFIVTVRGKGYLYVKNV